MKIRAVRSDAGDLYTVGQLLPGHVPPLRILRLGLNPNMVSEPVLTADGAPVLDQLEDDTGTDTGHGVGRTVEIVDPDHTRSRIAIYAAPDKGQAWYPGADATLPKGRALRRLISYPTDTGYVDFEGTFNEVVREAKHGEEAEKEDPPAPPPAPVKAEAASANA